MKRMLALLAILGAAFAVAAPMALAGGTSSTTCTSDMSGQSVNSTVPGTINSNLDVPAGATCQIRWGTVNGNVTVEGTLQAAASTFNGNVTVTGGHFSGFNQPNHITGNLTITGSTGDDGLFTNAPGFGWAPSGYGLIVDKNFTYTGNSARLYVGGTGMYVGKNYTYNTNTGGTAIDAPLYVNGVTSVS
jgi:hypothetical protein